MPITIRKITFWSSKEEESPHTVELTFNDRVVFDSSADSVSDSFIEGFLAALDEIEADYTFEVEEIYE